MPALSTTSGTTRQCHRRTEGTGARTEPRASGTVYGYGVGRVGTLGVLV